MADQMHGAASLANDSLHDFGLTADVGADAGAAFLRPAIAQ